MTQTESTTKQGLFARLFKKPTQEITVYDVDEQIAQVESERADLRAQLTIIEGELADLWGEDTSALEAQTITLTAKIAAAGQVLQRLQAERVEALKRQIVDTYRHKVEGIVSLVTELDSLETDEMLAEEKRIFERRAHRARLRTNISILKVNLGTDKTQLIREKFPESNPTITHAIHAAMDAVNAEFARYIGRNIVSLDILESGLFKRENHHE